MYPYRVSAGSTATPASRRRRRRTAPAATAAGAISTRSTCSRCRTRGSTRGSPPGTSRSTRSRGRTSIRRSPSTSSSCCCASGSSTRTARFRRTSGTSTTSTRRCTRSRRSASSPSTARRDVEFLERVFQKLLLNFTWWLNREDPDGNNLFGGGFLGLDNISPIDRSHLPDGMRARAGRRHRVDGLLLARDADHRDRAGRGERRLRRHGRQVPRAVRHDRATRSSSRACTTPRTASSTTGSSTRRATTTQMKVQTLVGSDSRAPRGRSSHWTGPMPPTASASGSRGSATRGTRAARRGSGSVRESGDARRIARLGDPPGHLRRTLSTFFDEAAFLSPYGLRAVSKRYEQPVRGRRRRRARGSTTSRRSRRTACTAATRTGAGPVWFPVNYLVIRQFAIYHRFFGDDFKLEYPTGSGQKRTLRRDRRRTSPTGWSSIWLPGADGRRPRVRRASSGCRPTRHGRTTSSSTSTSTATTAPGWAQRTRPAGRPSSRTSSSTRPAEREPASSHGHCPDLEETPMTSDTDAPVDLYIAAYNDPDLARRDWDAIEAARRRRPDQARRADSRPPRRRREDRGRRQLPRHRQERRLGRSGRRRDRRHLPAEPAGRCRSRRRARSRRRCPAHAWDARGDQVGGRVQPASEQLRDRRDLRGALGRRRRRALAGASSVKKEKVDKDSADEIKAAAATATARRLGTSGCAGGSHESDRPRPPARLERLIL